MADQDFGTSGRRWDALVNRAQWTLVWERLWPALVPIGLALLLFVAASWFGLWLVLPHAVRPLGIAAFVVLLVASLFGFWRWRWPARTEALARLDRDSGERHRPASTLEDTLAGSSDDAGTRALWSLHRTRAAEAAARLKVRAPSPRLVERDRWAVRMGVVLVLAAAAFVAGPEKYTRVLAAFQWQGPVPVPPGFRLDAWIDPPPYTGKPPLLLSARTEGAAENVRRLSVPVNATLVVRSSSVDAIKVDVSGGLEAPPAPVATDGAAPKPVPAASSAAPGESRWTLRGDGHVTMSRAGTVVASYDLAVIPDTAPTIALNGEPKANERGSLTLGYKTGDDYGVSSAEATFSAPIVRGKPVTGRTLVEPPKVALALPNAPGGIGTGETTTDLSEHPWAGTRATLVLSARDEGGNEGRSAASSVLLPQRPFTKPVAKALVEQRRNLLLAPDDRSKVAIAMDALTIEPDTFHIPASIYLGLRTIAQRLDTARDDDALRGVADLMWEMALRIEEGDLSQAQRDLRAAQQALRDALQRNASPEELHKLMQDLRAAMDKFLNEMAQNAERNQDQNAQNDPNAQTLTPQDLQAMLDRMEQMAQNGDKSEAQRMLDQMQQMLDNLQTARRGQQSPAQRQMNQALNDLDRMTRQQQELRDKTFRRNQQRQNNQAQRNQRGQPQRPDGQPQQPGADQQPGDQGDGDDQSADNDGDLQQQQEALSQQLENLKKQMQQLGMDGSQGLDDAGDAMKEAQDQLGQGQGQSGRDRAVGSQGRALEALRRGAQQLAQQMQGQGQGQGQAQGDPFGPGNPGNGPMRQGRANPSPDPLGRETHERGSNPASRYDPLGTPASQRAQQVLEELRRRLSDPSRPQDELDYLERLVKPY